MKIIGQKPDWERIQAEVALKPGIDTKEQYDDGCRRGDEFASMLFPEGQALEPTPVNIKAVHAALFYHVYEEAGFQRGPEQADVGLPGLGSVSPDNIHQALCDLHENTSKAMEQPELSSRAAAIACHCLKLKEIQAFMDASGRTSGFFLDRQIKDHLLDKNSELQKTFEFKIEADKYGEIMQEGIWNHDPKLMIEEVVGQAGIGDQILAEEGQGLSDILKSEKIKGITSSILSPSYPTSGETLSQRRSEQSMGLEDIVNARCQSQQSTQEHDTSHSTGR